MTTHSPSVPHVRPQRLGTRPDLAEALTRRRFIGGLAAASALAACGGSDTGAPERGFTLVQRFPNNVQVPGEIRLPITLSTGAAQFIQDGPATLTAQVFDNTGIAVGPVLSAVRRDVPPAPYYDFRTTIDEPGFCFLVVDGGPTEGAAFQVMDPRAVAVPTPGQQLPAFNTPTVDDDQDVDNLCTRAAGPCPFHDVSLDDALDTGRPVAYYVGTPEFCSTGSCAPALDALIAAEDRFGDAFTFVHVEVFTDSAGVDIAPAVAALGITYEPALFITDSTGTVVERLDAVWDETELAERLALYA